MRTVRCGGRLWRGGVCQGVCQGVGMSAQVGVSQWGRHSPWIDFLTQACENITFSQPLLRTVKIWIKSGCRERQKVLNTLMIVIDNVLNAFCLKATVMLISIQSHDKTTKMVAIFLFLLSGDWNPAF